MANKKYNVTQKVNLGGSQKSVGFGFVGEVAQLSALLALMEGGFSVTEENVALTDLTSAETVVTAYNTVSKIGMSAKALTGEPLFTSIKPYQGSMIFKDTASIDDIKTALTGITPWGYAPTVKASRIQASFSDTVASEVH